MQSMMEVKGAGGNKLCILMLIKCTRSNGGGHRDVYGKTRVLTPF